MLSGTIPCAVTGQPPRMSLMAAETIFPSAQPGFSREPIT